MEKMVGGKEKCIVLCLGLGCLMGVVLGQGQTTTSGYPCGCMQGEIFINSSNDGDNSYDLYPFPNYQDLNCKNISCLNCTYRVKNQFSSPLDAIQILYDSSIYQCELQILMTNCKTSNNLLDPYKYLVEYTQYGVLTQEPELCISFSSRSPEGRCSYGYEGYYRCHWHLNFQYMTNGSAITYGFGNMELMHLSLDAQYPYSAFTFSDLTEDYVGFSMSVPNNYSMELWAGSTYNESENYVALYNSNSLTNYISTILPWTNFQLYAKSNSSLTITLPTLEGGISSPLFWRIPELHSANCNDTTNIGLAFPLGLNFSKTISALPSGECMYSILMDQNVNYLPILHILDMSYVGSGNVKVEAPLGFKIGNETMFDWKLFEFGQDTAKFYVDRFVYGNLFNFIIPAGGQLSITYDTDDWTNYTLPDNLPFDNYTQGIIQSIGYPLAFPHQDVMQTFSCNNGLASYTFNIVLADITKTGFLTIYADSYAIYNQRVKGRVVNQTMSFNATQVLLFYSSGIGGHASNGLLLRYEAVYVGNEGASTSTVGVWTSETTVNATTAGTTHTSNGKNVKSCFALILGALLAVIGLKSSRFLALCLLFLALFQTAYGQGATSTMAPCACYTPSTFYLNSSDSYSSIAICPSSTMTCTNDGDFFSRDAKTHTITSISPIERDSFNCPCQSCSYKIHTDFYDPVDAIYLDFQIFSGTCNSYVTLTNCKKDSPSMLVYLQERYRGGGGGSGTLYEAQFYLQEQDLCLEFSSNSSNGVCNYDAFTTGCNWQLNVDYVWQGKFAGDKTFVQENFNLTKSSPISMMNLDYESQVVGIHAETGTLELRSMSFNNSGVYVPLYEAPNLTNFFSTLVSDKEILNQQKVVSNNDYITMQKPPVGIIGGNFEMMFRIPEVHSMNCNTMENLNFAFPVNTTFTSSISATNNGSCMFTILVSRHNEISEYDMRRALPILHIHNVSYIGSSSVQAFSEFIKNNFLPNPDKKVFLFDFNQQNSAITTDFYLYGDLIHFIVPPNGVLNLVYTARNIFTTPLYPIIAFDGFKHGVIQSINYPLPGEYEENFVQQISCSKGIAQFNMTIVFAGIIPRSYLKIYGDGHLIVEYKTTCLDKVVVRNETLSFSAKNVLVVFNVPTAVSEDYLLSENTRGVLINFDGKYISS